MSDSEFTDVLTPVNPEGNVNKAATQDLCCYAFDALYCELLRRERVSPKLSDEM